MAAALPGALTVEGLFVLVDNPLSDIGEFDVGVLGSV